ncbi:hypothetical protein DL96DRAFT_1666039 [Flagelloscypha sp. PMI_526]|nr:hypothetical protein DL96DRAFT_1666039 [Flagelloscypha sp. PMI_526]
MQSLRSRKSQAPPRKNPSQRPGGAGAGGGTRLAKAPGSGPRPQARKNTKGIDDRIKKRMSMRYADISSPTETAGVPALPSIPAGIGAGGRLRDRDEAVRDRSLTKNEARIVHDDRKLLDKKEFDPDDFLKLKMANSTEVEIRSLQSSLRTAKDDTASDLQRTVFKNYAELVLISKEISTLENEMLELKESLSEYKSMPSLLHIADPTVAASNSATSNFRRSSVADLRIMYYNQMQTLHAQIEGSAKFAPSTPGRHVVGEIDNVLALNAATYKVTGKVKFVVLDDAVLVAKRRRRNAGSERRGGSEGKLVAERCWPLNEMLVLDTKDSATMTNVFKIKHNKETHVYRTETSADKKSLLLQFRQVAEELSAKKRKEREGEHERRKTLYQAGGSAVPDWMADLAMKAGETSNDGSKSKAERDGRWLNEWADDLTVSIALREWEKAVNLVEEGKAKMNLIPAVGPKLTLLTAQLNTSLLASISLSSNRRSNVIALATWLTRLGAGSAARSSFLAMRSNVLDGLIRKIRFEGHIGAYVGDLATVYFTCIKHTADWFLASWKENEVASAFIEWARQEVVKYCDMFRKQVYSDDVERKVVEEAKNITYAQSRKLLQEYGLDFRFLLDDLLQPRPTSLDAPWKNAPIIKVDISALREKISTSTSIKRDPSPLPSPSSRRARSPVPPVAPIVVQPPESPKTTAPLRTRARRPSNASSTRAEPVTPSAPLPPMPAMPDPPSIPAPVPPSEPLRPRARRPSNASSTRRDVSPVPRAPPLPNDLPVKAPPSPTPSNRSVGSRGRTPTGSASGFREIVSTAQTTNIPPPPVPLLSNPIPRRAKTPPPQPGDNIPIRRTRTPPPQPGDTIPPRRERPPKTLSTMSSSSMTSEGGRVPLLGPRGSRGNGIMGGVMQNGLPSGPIPPRSTQRPGSTTSNPSGASYSRMPPKEGMF